MHFHDVVNYSNKVKNLNMAMIKDLWTDKYNIINFSAQVSDFALYPKNVGDLKMYSVMADGDYDIIAHTINDTNTLAQIHFFELNKSDCH